MNNVLEHPAIAEAALLQGEQTGSVWLGIESIRRAREALLAAIRAEETVPG
jgi:hypothetical protein